MLFVVDARAGVTPGDEELAADPARVEEAGARCSRTRSTTRRRRRSRSSSTGSASASRSRSPALHGSNTGDLLDEIVAPAARDASRRRWTRTRSASRSSAGRTSASRRSTTSSSARSARSSPRSRARRATRSTPCSSAAAGRSCSSTPPGLRRKRKQRQGIEYYSELRALEAAERADVALVLIDASEGIVEGDITAVEVARKAQCATLVVLSKWDVSTGDDRGGAAGAAARVLRQRPPFITVSSKTGRGVSRLLEQGRGAVRQATSRRIPTPELNRFLAELREARQPPSQGQAPAEPALRRAGADAAAALPLHRQRPRPRHARLRLLGREPAARAVRAGGRPGGDRLPRARREASSSSAAARGARRSRACSRDRGHDVVRSRRATTIDEAPYDEADLVVLAVPSSSFRRGARSQCAATRRSSASSRGSTRRRASGSRRSSRPPGRGALGPEHGRGGARRGCPGAAVIASRTSARRRLQDAINSLAFRVYVNTT